MWFPNSKACHHVTYDPANLARSQSYNRVDNLLIGNGKGLSIYNVGYNSFDSALTNGKTLMLHDILCA